MITDTEHQIVELGLSVRADAHDLAVENGRTTVECRRECGR
jgi:hypothetical protein